MIMKTAMGIATKNLAAWDDESLFAALYAPTMIKPRYKTAEEGVPRRSAPLLLMPDPVNAWTRPLAAGDEGPLQGARLLRE